MWFLESCRTAILGGIASREVSHPRFHPQHHGDIAVTDFDYQQYDMGAEI